MQTPEDKGAEAKQSRPNSYNVNTYGRTKPVMTMKSSVGLDWVIFLMLCSATILFVTGYCSPAWSWSWSASQGNGTQSYQTNFGLWQICTTSPDTQQNQYNFAHDVGAANNYVVCQPVAGYNWFTAVQAFETLGLICLVIAAILSALFMFQESMKCLGVANCTVVLSFAAGIFIMIGIIVFGAEVNEENLTTGNPFQYLSWSFAVVVAAGSLSIIAAFLASVNVCCIGGCTADRPV